MRECEECGEQLYRVLDIPHKRILQCVNGHVRVNSYNRKRIRRSE